MIQWLKDLFNPIRHAVVSYEAWPGGKLARVGNFSIDYRGYAAPDILDECIDYAAGVCGCEKNEIRIVGMWRLV